VNGLLLVDIDDKQVGSVTIENGVPVYEGMATKLNSIRLDPAADPERWLRHYAFRYRGPYVRAIWPHQLNS
jgi:hypothetical protein